MNSCQVRRAFGQAKPWFEGVDDLSRVIHRPDEICLLLCGAGESGWGLAFPEGTRSFLNRFESCWDRVGPEIGARWRLRCAVMGAARHFQKTMGRTDQADDWDLVGPPYATVTALLLRDGYAHCVWVGGGQVHLLSQGQLLAATVPDTRPQKLTTPCQQNNFQALSADDIKNIPNSLVAAIHPGQTVPLNEVSWALPPRGQLILNSYHFPKGLSLPQSMALLQLETQELKTKWLHQHGKDWPFYCVLSCECC